MSELLLAIGVLLIAVGAFTYRQLTAAFGDKGALVLIVGLGLVGASFGLAH